MNCFHVFCLYLQRWKPCIREIYFCPVFVSLEYLLPYILRCNPYITFTYKCLRCSLLPSYICYTLIQEDVVWAWCGRACRGCVGRWSLPLIDLPFPGEPRKCCSINDVNIFNFSVTAFPFVSWTPPANTPLNSYYEALQAVSPERRPLGHLPRKPSNSGRDTLHHISYPVRGRRHRDRCGGGGVMLWTGSEMLRWPLEQI